MESNKRDKIFIIAYQREHAPAVLCNGFEYLHQAEQYLNTISKFIKKVGPYRYIDEKPNAVIKDYYIYPVEIENND